MGDVYGGSDAAAKGMVRDEEILSIGGTSVTGLSRADVEALLDAYTLGMTVLVELAGGVKEILVEDLLPAVGPGPAQRPLTAFASADFLLAAWLAWMTPLETALSSFLEATTRAVPAASLSPPESASRTRRM